MTGALIIFIGENGGGPASAFAKAHSRSAKAENWSAWPASSSLMRTVVGRGCACERRINMESANNSVAAGTYAGGVLPSQRRNARRVTVRINRPRFNAAGAVRLE